MPRSRNYQTKLLEDLRAPDEAAEYLNAALEEGDRELFLLALRNVADAQGGLSKLAETTDLNRENLYRMLSEKGNPEFYSLYTLLSALGLRLAVQAKEANPDRVVPSPAQNKVLVLRARKAVAAPFGKGLALAADTAHDQPGKIILVTPEGNEAGTLEYDFEQAELYLDITGALPKWHTLDVEIQTDDGKKFQEATTRETGTKLVLSRGRPVKRDKIESVTIRPRQG